jgi:hypothetical protein
MSMPSFVPQPFGEQTPTPAAPPAPAAPPLVMAPAPPPMPAMPAMPPMPLQSAMPPAMPPVPTAVMPPPVPKFAALAPQPYAPASIPGAPYAPPVLPPGQRRAAAFGERFGVHWWALLIAAPLVVIQFAAAQSVAEARNMSGGKGVYLATSVLWPAVFATVAAFGLWWVCRRSRKASTIAFLVVYAGFTLPDLFKLAGGGPSKTMANSAPQRVYVPDVVTPQRIPPTTFTPLQSSTGSGDSSEGNPVESGGMKIVARPGVRRTVVAPDPATVAPPKPAAPRVPTFKEAIAKATAAINDAQAKTAAPTQRWTSLGGSDMSGVKSEQDLADRIEVLDDLASAIRGARDAADGARDQLRKDLAAAKLPIAMRDNQVAVWAADQRIEDERQVAYAAEKYVAAWRSQLVTLQKEWGRWWVDGNGRVGFKNQQTGKQYDRGASDVESARKQLSRAVSKSRNSLLSGNASVLAGR